MGVQFELSKLLRARHPPWNVHGRTTYVVTNCSWYRCKNWSHEKVILGRLLLIAYQLSLLAPRKKSWVCTVTISSRTCSEQTCSVTININIDHTPMRYGKGAHVSKPQVMPSVVRASATWTTMLTDGSSVWQCHSSEQLQHYYIVQFNRENLNSAQATCT